MEVYGGVCGGGAEWTALAVSVITIQYIYVYQLFIFNVNF